MRELKSHQSNPCNASIRIVVNDEPGPGGANHKYRVSGPIKNHQGVGDVPSFGVNLRFQKGPIAETGVNGITNEALLAVLIDRMEGFQRGPFACEDNAAALTALQTAMAILHRRTKARVDRGVEGRHKP